MTESLLYSNNECSQWSYVQYVLSLNLVAIEGFIQKRRQQSAPVWGTEVIQDLAAQSILHQNDERKMMICTDMKKRGNSSYSLKSPGAKYS